MGNLLSGVQVNSRQESFMLLVASLQAFFLGAFLSLLLISSHVLFLRIWTPADIPQAYIISGIFGILIFSVYSYLNSRLKFRFFITLWILLLFGGSVLLYTFYDAVEDVKLFGIECMMPFTLALPVNFLILLLFRKQPLEILSPNQQRRLHGVIRTAFVIGVVAASYTLFTTTYLQWDIVLILAFSAGFIGIVFILQLIINYHHRNAGVFPQPLRRTSKLHSRFYEMFYTRYTLLVILFAVLSATVGFIIHYNFITETRFHYPSSLSLVRFFGFFTGTMFLFVFGVERILLRKILYAYNSPYSLVLIPAVLILASLASFIVDLLVGQSNAFARFSFGFLMVAMLRIGYETTYEAIEVPSLRVLFRTLDLRFVGAIKPRMGGTVRMISLLTAGLILVGILTLDLSRSLFINLTVFILTIVWLPVGIKLVKAYQNALREYIRRLKSSKRAIVQEMLSIDEKTHFLINGTDPVKSVNTLSIIERLEPLTHERHLVSLLTAESPQLRKYVLERIDENALLYSLSNLKQIQMSDPAKQNGYLSKLVNKFEIKLKSGSTRKAIETIANSQTLTDRILAAEIIGNSGNQEYADYLLQLFRDIEPEVKLASVKAMARLANPAHSYVLIGYLNTPQYYPYAFEALVKIGDPALPFMEENFLLPETDDKLLLRIVRIYGKIGTQAAIDSLLSKIENQSRSISRQAILALREAKFQATPGNINRILNDIVRLINIMSWNFGVYASIKDYREFSLLTDSLRSEINDNYEILYHLLALAYNPTSIGNIKLMLSEGSDVDISFAVELLDQIVNEDIKQVFFPVVENISVKERFKQLQYFFQVSKYDPDDLIVDIITRDFNQISLYVKACAIYSVLSSRKIDATQELIATIFHPNQLISETAAYVLYSTKPDMLESVYDRLAPERVVELKSSMSHLNDGIPFLLLDRIRFIKNCAPLRNISEDILFEICRALDVHYMKPNEEYLIKREDVHFAFMIIIDGEAQINISSGKVFTFGKNDIIYSDILVEDCTYSFKALTDLRFYSLEQEVLNSLMFDHIDFRDTILEIIETA